MARLLYVRSVSNGLPIPATNVELLGPNAENRPNNSTLDGRVGSNAIGLRAEKVGGD